MERIQGAAKEGFKNLQTACDRIKDKLRPLVFNEVIDFSSNKVDNYSQRLVPVTEASVYRALKTTGDGNCFFRAASILAFLARGQTRRNAPEENCRACYKQIGKHQELLLATM